MNRCAIPNAVVVRDEFHLAHIGLVSFRNENTGQRSLEACFQAIEVAKIRLETYPSPLGL